MWAAGRWGPTFPSSYAGFSADCRPRSRPSSGSFSVPMTGARGQGLEVVRSPSPPLPLSCSNSTRSLLSPLGHQSFQFDEDDGDGEDEEDVDEDAHDSEAKVASLRGMELQGCASTQVESENNQEEQKQVRLPESRLTPWEVWFIGKEKEERDRLQLKALEELNQQLEKRKEMEEREKRKIIAEEKHKEWVQKKNEQVRRGKWIHTLTSLLQNISSYYTSLPRF
ncbi:CCDC34 isoform 2 [Pan troglodytes]|uniref:CCDC34 isoform 2 n=1 Tax=Pan troglodytes TaxID=9598 RepID=A0A2J8P4G9_PANTR|nr:CCDC34 isoform 2 [Pan troglodytes]